MRHSSTRSGFTLIELLLVMAIVGVVAGIVILAISPRKNILSAYDAERVHSSKQMVNAMYSHLIDQWEQAGGGTIKEGIGNSKPICRPSISSADCASEEGVDLSVLPPEFLTDLPVDPAEPDGSKCTGYRIYEENTRINVFSDHLGKMPGEALSSCCVSGGDPYVICTCDDLQNALSNMSGNYELGSNVSCGESFGNFEPIAGEFNGVFDGKNAIIKNLTIDKSSDPTNFVGMFRQLGEGGEIRDITLENVNVSSGGGGVGALVGLNLGTIDNAHVTGVVTGANDVGGLVGIHADMGSSNNISRSSANVAVDAVTIAGGLVGQLANGLLENSFATGNVTATSPTIGWTGGLVGRTVGGTIRNSYATGDVTGNGTSIGGLIGITPFASWIFNSFATGRVNGSSEVGGLVGESSGGTPVNSYWFAAGGNETGCIGSGGACGVLGAVSDVYGNSHDVYTVGATTWDFTNIWLSNSEFPTLQ